LPTALFGNALKYCTILGNISVYATRNATRHPSGLDFTRLFGGFDSRQQLFSFALVNTGFFLYLQGFLRIWRNRMKTSLFRSAPQAVGPSCSVEDTVTGALCPASQYTKEKREEKQMDVTTLMQYISYGLIAIGVMAFLVSAITQVIKSWPGLSKLPTSAVVLVLSLILCPAVLVAAMAWLDQPIQWYMIFASILAAFIVALVSMDGWERLKEIWERTGYKDKK
jgi:hypothetical protein